MAGFAVNSIDLSVLAALLGWSSIISFIGFDVAIRVLLMVPNLGTSFLGIKLRSRE